MTSVRAASFAAAAIIGAVIVWVALSGMTGLIFHLMPAAPALAGAFAYRWARPEASIPQSTTLALAAAGIAAGVIGAEVVRATGGLLDEPLAVVAAIGAGSVIGPLLARRRSGKAERPGA